MNLYYLFKKAFSEIKPKTDDETFIRQIIERANNKKA